jgi:hypothetical protein
MRFLGAGSQAVLIPRLLAASTNVRARLVFSAPARAVVTKLAALAAPTPSWTFLRAIPVIWFAACDVGHMTDTRVACVGV